MLRDTDHLREANSGGWAETFVDDIAERVVRKMEERGYFSGPAKFMDAEEAAEFINMSYSEFRRKAPGMPRYKQPGVGYRYWPEDLLKWKRAQNTCDSYPFLGS